MLGLKAALEHAQQVKEYLLQYDLLDKNYRLFRQDDAIYFPVTRDFSPPFDFDVEFVDVELPENDQAQSFKDMLAEELTPKEMDELVKSYDIVGSIAIIEVPDALVPKQELIGTTILDMNKSVTTVLKKVGGHEGEYRTQRMECIAGEDTREATVTENGCRLKVNVEEAYYSVRMSTERKRIVELVKPGERILCLFSGVAPYPIILSKHTEAKEIIGVEINPVAHELALENVAMNRCTNVHLLLGDAHKYLKTFARDNQKFDRVTTPLPHTAADFLDGIVEVMRDGGTIHYYSFQHENELEKAVDELRAALRRAKKRLGQYSVIKAGQHAPRIWRVVVDGEVVK